jgi:hypothetical protein
MRSLLLILIILNCYTIPTAVGPTHGLVYTNNKFPGEFNTFNDVKSEVSAKDCMYQIANLIVWGNAAAGKIAFENNIIRIATIDHETVNVNGIFSTYCTIVTGEKK